MLLDIYVIPACHILGSPKSGGQVSVTCDRCGSENVKALGNFASGRRIGICQDCGENFVIYPSGEPRPVELVVEWTDEWIS